MSTRESFSHVDYISRRRLADLLFRPAFQVELVCMGWMGVPVENVFSVDELEKKNSYFLGMEIKYNNLKYIVDGPA